MGTKTYTLSALSALWTGDIDGQPGRLITTGLLGSIRWWFEVVVRGLGGFACDPSAKSKDCLDRNHCVACELFGCTGWARKFRFDVFDMFDGYDRPQEKQITKDTTFRLRFTPLRPIRDEEWALLDLTLRLIADYGALGGKTVYKPTKQDSRMDKQHHQDFGLVEIREWKGDGPSFQRSELKAYVDPRDWHVAEQNGQGGFAWASLEYFWFVNGKTLARENNQKSSFNQVVDRPEAKNQASGNSSWLSGGTGESKKVFSFRDPARTFGFVKPGTISHDDMLDRLKTAWPSLKDEDYQKGSAILDKLLAKPVEASS